MEGGSGDYTVNNVFFVSKGPQNAGTFKMSSGAIGWKSKSTGKTVTVGVAEVQELQWMRSFHAFMLKVALKNGTSYRFEGFNEKEFPLLADFVKSKTDLSLTKSELSSKGWNWGSVGLQGGSIVFRADDKETFDIPLSEVSNVTTTGSRMGQQRDEVMLEFHMDDTQIGREDESLAEMRLYMPSNIEGQMDAEAFFKAVQEKADIGVDTGDGICRFDDVGMLTPRGRYELEMFPTFLRLHGKSYDYKVLYSSIERLFVLPKPDKNHVFFVISLDPPIRQGQTHYPHLIMQFAINKPPVTVQLKITEEALNTKYKDRGLSQQVSGAEHDVITKVLKGLTGKKVFGPGSFRIGDDSACCLKCSMKANDGLLYPLEKSFFFLHKPPTYIRHDEIKHIEFSRVGSQGGTSTSTKNFDITITLNGSGTIQFTNLARDSFKTLFDFLEKKSLKLKNASVEAEAAHKTVLAELDDDDDEDPEDAEDYQESESDSGSDDDSDADEDEDESEEEKPKKKPKKDGDGGDKKKAKK
eukprot:tig00000076_g2391.t1